MAARCGGLVVRGGRAKSRLLMILCVLALNLLLAGVATVDGKRAFAIRMRSKSNHNTGSALGRNSRKNYHHMHQDGVGGMVRNPPVPDIQPPRPIGWSVDGHSNSHPIGPPPAYPGLGHHAVPGGGAPPAYSHSKINPPSYAEAVGAHQHGYAAAAPLVGPRHYDYAHNSALYGDSNAIGSSYGSSYGYHQRGSSPFSMGSILTGAALWHVAHGIGHRHHHHGVTGGAEHGIHSEEHFYHHNHHSHHGEGETSTLPPEVENPHIQVNANFDFGPSPNPQEATQPVPAESTTSEPGVGGQTNART
uniref:Uncharacterized protein n=1 Tax=Anopheles farauti TaxID=69004 RepID=A0A182QUI8_9DIPT